MVCRWILPLAPAQVVALAQVESDVLAVDPKVFHAIGNSAIVHIQPPSNLPEDDGPIDIKHWGQFDSVRPHCGDDFIGGSLKQLRGSDQSAGEQVRLLFQLAVGVLADLPPECVEFCTSLVRSSLKDLRVQNKMTDLVGQRVVVPCRIADRCFVVNEHLLAAAGYESVHRRCPKEVFGNDTIIGFDANPAGGQDLLNIAAFNLTAATFASRVSIADAGNDVLVTVGGADGGNIRLVGVTDHTSVTIADFQLV